jgi:hypothetical protein
MQLEVVADLQLLLAATPTRQWFGQIKQEETATRTFAFEGTRLSDARLSDIRLKQGAEHPDAFSWTVEDTREGNSGELAISVSVDAGKIPPGRFNDVLVVSTNFDQMENIELLLSGEVLGPISVNPQRLYFGQFEIGKEMDNTLILTANNDVSFKILTATIDDQEFKVGPWKSDSATEHELVLTFSPKTTRDRVRTALLITTDMETQKDLQVEIHAYQRRTRTGTRQSPAGTETRSRQAPSSLSGIHAGQRQSTKDLQTGLRSSAAEENAENGH